MATSYERPLIALVGPCGAGKSTISKMLNERGIFARAIAQEHSYVPSMWQKLTNPIYLIFLDASYPETIRRRRLNWNMDEYQEQHRRLSHARQHADLYIFTDPHTPEEVLNSILIFLETRDKPSLSNL
jgi:guanylate kinase